MFHQARYLPPNRPYVLPAIVSTNGESTNPSEKDSLSTNPQPMDASFIHITIESLKADVTNLTEKTNTELSQINKEISNLKDEKIPANNYFDNAEKLNIIALYAILISPIVVILATFVIHVYLSDNKSIVEDFKFFIGIVGIIAVIQVGMAYFKINTIVETCKKTKDRVDKIETYMKDIS